MDRGAWWATVQQRGISRGGNSPRNAGVLTQYPRAVDGTARTVAEDSQPPGLLVLASLTTYVCGKLASKTC